MTKEMPGEKYKAQQRVQAVLRDDKKKLARAKWNAARNNRPVFHDRAERGMGSQGVKYVCSEGFGPTPQSIRYHLD